MPNPDPSLNPAKLRRRTLSRWGNEGVPSQRRMEHPHADMARATKRNQFGAVHANMPSMMRCLYML